MEGPCRSFPMTHVHTQMESALPFSHSNTGISLPTSSPLSCPHAQLSFRDFYPNGWKWEAFAQEWPGCLLPPFQSSGSRQWPELYLRVSPSVHKNLFNITPTQPCPIMPQTQPHLLKADLFFLSHTDSMVQTNSPGRHLEFNRDKFRAKQNKSLSYDAEDLCQASTQD